MKEALAKLREYKRDDVIEKDGRFTAVVVDDDKKDSGNDDNKTTNSTSTSVIGSDNDTATTTNNNNNNSNNNNEVVMTILDSSGRKYQGALTLIGYKGGSLESQINQDRAVVISPYYVVGDDEMTMMMKKEESKQPPPPSPPGRRSRPGLSKHMTHRAGGTMDENTDQRLFSRLIGVFDGHARLGELVSQYSVTELPLLLATKLGQIVPKDDPTQIIQALIDTFIEIDKTAPAEISGGCTASVILQRNSKVYVANAGDSRSFLVVYRANTQTVQVLYISREDKPNLPDERARVEQMGGEVYLPLMGTSRVLYTDPDSGLQSGLAMSRSIGDWEVGRLGVIPDPIVAVIDIHDVVEGMLYRDCQIPDEDEVMNAACFSSSDDIHVFAVSATDGLMDFATPEIVAQTVASSLYHKDGPHLLSALEQLIYLAAQGWEQTKQGRYRDDIAIAVSEIRIPPPRPSQ
jgi:serine/threonine protein phosphatase PrpC